MLRIKALLLLCVGVVQCEYTLPCQTGSLYSGNYQLDESGYFCTEPVRILYNSSSVVQGISSNLGDIYTYGNDVPSFTDQNIQPCNCYSQPIQWKSETLSIANEYPTAAEYVVMIQNKQKETESTLEEWNPLDKNVGTPCVYTQLGYTWAVSSEELPDPMILSIPPGEYISALKTGAGISTFQNPDADPSPCGVVARDVYQTVVLDGNNSAVTAADFNSRPGSMPVTDYCASMEPFSVSDWSLNTPTQNVFMATLLRLTAPMEMVRQCKTGIWEAVLLAGGLQNFDGSPKSFQTTAPLPTIIEFFGSNAMSFNDAIMVCSKDHIVKALNYAVQRTMSVVDTIMAANPTSQLSQYNTLKTIGSDIDDLGSLIEECSYGFIADDRYCEKFSVNTQRTDGAHLQLSLKGTTITYHSYKLQSVTWNGTRAGLDYYDYNIIDGYAIPYTGTKGTNIMSSLRTYFMEQYLSTPKESSYFYQLSECFYDQSCYESIVDNKVDWPCPSDAYLSFKAPAGSSWENLPGPTNTGYQSMLLCSPPPFYNTVLSNGVSITVDVSKPGSQELLAGIIQDIVTKLYYMGELAGNNEPTTQFIDYFRQQIDAFQYESSIYDLHENDYTIGSPYYYGIFDTNQGPLSFEAVDITNNPFNPLGFATHVAQCLDSSLTQGDFFVVPGTLAYYTQNQVNATFGNFFSEPNTQNGFVQVLMDIHKVTNYNDMSFSSIDYSGNVLEQVGYNNNNLLVTSLIGTDCQPTHAFYNAETTYFAPRSQDLAGREYQNIHTATYNALVATNPETLLGGFAVYTDGLGTANCLFFDNAQTPVLASVGSNDVCFTSLTLSADGKEIVTTTGGRITNILDLPTTLLKPILSDSDCSAAGGHHYASCEINGFTMHYCGDVADSTYQQCNGEYICPGGLQYNFCGAVPSVPLAGLASPAVNTLFYQEAPVPLLPILTAQDCAAAGGSQFASCTDEYGHVLTYCRSPTHPGYQSCNGQKSCSGGQNNFYCEPFQYVTSEATCTEAGGNNYVFCEASGVHYCNGITSNAFYRCGTYSPCPSNANWQYNACPVAPVPQITITAYCIPSATTGCNLPLTLAQALDTANARSVETMVLPILTAQDCEAAGGSQFASCTDEYGQVLTYCRSPTHPGYQSCNGQKSCSGGQNNFYCEPFQYVTSQATCTEAGGNNYVFCEASGVHYCNGITSNAFYRCGTYSPCPSNANWQNNACPALPPLSPVFQPAIPWSPNTNSLQTIAQEPPVYDNLHCVTKTTQGHLNYLEKPSFLQPGYSPLSAPQPPGLSVEQLDAWCQNFTNCTDIAYNLCMPVNGTCRLRQYDYGALSRIPGATSQYIRTRAMCARWDPMFDDVSVCQRADAFTGCVLVQTRSLKGNTSVATTYDGISIRVPNSFERFVTTSVNTETRYTTTVYRVALSIPGENAANVAAVGGGLTAFSLVMQYVDNNGILQTATQVVQYAAPVNWTEFSQAGYMYDTYIRNPAWFNSTYFWVPLNPPLVVTIGVVYQGKTTPTPNPDYERLSLRISCTGDFNCSYAPLVNALLQIGDQASFGKLVGQPTVARDAVLGLACVPLAEKVLFQDTIAGNTANMSALVNAGRVFKTMPVDCNTLGYNTKLGKADMDMYKSECENQMDTYRGIYTGTMADFAGITFSDWYANRGSSIALLTHWSQSLATTDSAAAYFFETSGSSTTSYSTGIAPCARAEVCAASELAGFACTSGSQTCGIMMDKTYLEPCSILEQINVPRCSKPQIQLLYPEYDPVDPTAAGAFAQFPINIWKWTAGLAAFNAGSMTRTTVLNAALQTPIPVVWNEQLTFVHYCDQYLGGYVYCDNDPYSQQKRQELCESLNASILYVGLTVQTLTLADVCPFTFLTTTDVRECYIFPGHPSLGSLASLMSVLRNTLDSLEGITFYYVPFSYQALQYIFMNAAFTETLYTNSFNLENASFMNEDNIQETGRNAQLLALPMIKAMADQARRGLNAFANEQGMCNRNVALSRDIIDLYYTAIMYTQNGEGGNFEFVSVQTSPEQTTQNVVSMAPSQVFPDFNESGTLINVNGITLLPALSTVPIVISNSNPNTAIDCTRFIVDAENFVVQGLIFDQSGCVFVEESNRIPIVFSGASGANAYIANITTIDAPVVVAFYGGSAVYYSEAAFINGNNMTMLNIRMTYTQDCPLSGIMRHNLAVLGKTVGNVNIQHCQDATCTQTDAAGTFCNAPYCGCNASAVCYEVNEPANGILQGRCSPTTDAAGSLGFSWNNQAQATLLGAWLYTASMGDSAATYAVRNGDWVWTIDNSTTSLNNTLVIARPSSQANGVLFQELVIALNNDNTYGSATRLQLYTTTDFNSAAWNPQIAEQLTAQASYRSYCIAEVNLQLVLRPCYTAPEVLSTDLALFYINGITYSIHSAWSPYLCYTARVTFTSTSVPLYREPCTPCNIGVETHVPCLGNLSWTQWLVNVSTAIATRFNLSATETMPTLYLSDTFPGMCLTRNLQTGAYFWSPCDACLWEREQLAIGDNRAQYSSWCATAIGVQRFACNPLSSAALSQLVGTPDFCTTHPGLAPTPIDGTNYGLGAIIACSQTNELVIIRGGYGYFGRDPAVQYPTYTTDTYKVIIQPYEANGFDVAGQGVQVVNISEYTNIFGKAYESNVFGAPAKTRPLFVVSNIILGIINGLLLILHIGLIIYDKELKDIFASPAPLS